MPESMLLAGFLLLAAALLLIIIDLFVPSMGVLLLTAVVVAVAGVVCLWMHDTVSGLIGTGIVIFGGPALALLFLQIMPYTPVGRRLVLGAPSPEERTSPPPKDKAAVEAAAQVGKEGLAVTALRPVGTVRIGESSFDALAESQVIAAGTRVKVIGVVDGTTLRVRPL